MPSPLPSTDAGALGRAVRRLVRQLAAETAPGSVARIQAEVRAADVERVFQCEAALTAAWPAAAGRAPRREMIWTAGGPATESGLRLQAFDDAGRPLLRLSYGKVSVEAAR